MTDTAAMLVAAYRQTIEQQVPPAATVCIALSGGMDSRVLLDIACRVRRHYPVCACHINHDISPRAGEWEQFCRRLCTYAEVPLSVFNVSLTPASSENEARQVRLQAYAQIPAAAIILAHHADDQVETVLFRLLRGSGVRGLAAMQTAVELPDTLLLRPWLAVPRRLIAEYAEKEQLQWIEDEDNRNLRRRRNYLREQVIPSLSPGFADYRQKITAAAARLHTAAELLLLLARQDEVAAVREDGSLQLAVFRALGEARSANWLYYALRARGQQLSERHIKEAVRQMLHSRRGLCLHLAQEVVLQTWRGALYWDKTITPPADFSCRIAVQPGEHYLPALGGRLILEKAAGKGLAPAKTGSEVMLCLRQGGESLRAPRRRRQTLSALFQAAAVPPWRRQRLPLLFASGQLAAVAGVTVAASFAAAADEEGLNCRFEWDEQVGVHT